MSTQSIGWWVRVITFGDRKTVLTSSQTSFICSGWDGVLLSMNCRAWLGCPFSLLNVKFGRKWCLNHSSNKLHEVILYHTSICYIIHEILLFWFSLHHTFQSHLVWSSGTLLYLFLPIWVCLIMSVWVYIWLWYNNIILNNIIKLRIFGITKPM